METSDGVVFENKNFTFFDTSTYLKPKRKNEYIYSVVTALLTFFIFGKNILLYPIAFIVFDILSIVLSKTVNLFFLIKFNRMSLQDKKDYLVQQKNALNSWYSGSSSLEELRSEAKYKISDLINEIEDLLEKEKQAIEDNPKTENIEIASYINTLNEYKKKINIIRTEENKDFLKTLNTKLKEIINLVMEKPSTSTFSNKLFNLYIPEIILLLNNFPKSEDEKEEYKNNIIEVLEAIDILADNTKKTIISYNQRNVEISFDVLKREIKKAGEELDADD